MRSHQCPPGLILCEDLATLAQFAAGIRTRRKALGLTQSDLVSILMRLAPSHVFTCANVSSFELGQTSAMSLQVVGTLLMGFFELAEHTSPAWALANWRPPYRRGKEPRPLPGPPLPPPPPQIRHLTPGPPPQDSTRSVHTSVSSNLLMVAPRPAPTAATLPTLRPAALAPTHSTLGPQTARPPMSSPPFPPCGPTVQPVHMPTPVLQQGHPAAPPLIAPTAPTAPQWPQMPVKDKSLLPAGSDNPLQFLSPQDRQLLVIMHNLGTDPAFRKMVIDLVQMLQKDVKLRWALKLLPLATIVFLFSTVSSQHNVSLSRIYNRVCSSFSSSRETSEPPCSTTTRTCTLRTCSG